jgi:hypothetical protein
MSHFLSASGIGVASDGLVPSLVPAEPNIAEAAVVPCATLTHLAHHILEERIVSRVHCSGPLSAHLCGRA